MRDKIKNFVARRISWSIIYKAMAYKTFPKFAAQYGDFRLGQDYGDLQVSGMASESKMIRGELVKFVSEIRGSVTSLLLPGENNQNKQAFADLFSLPASAAITAGLLPEMDAYWDFEQDPPKLAPVSCIMSQAMLEHLIDPYKHVRDCYGLLEPGGHLIIHTQLPGFHYHRYPVDCLRFYPDWFEEVAKRLGAVVAGKHLHEAHIIYMLKKPA